MALENEQPKTCITLSNVGKRYQYEWIFRQVNYQFQMGESYALLGSNGSGKSTLLQIIAGSLAKSEGTITYQVDEQMIAQELFSKHLSWASPYMELIEEFSLKEILSFQAKFKPFLAGWNMEKILSLLALPTSPNKRIQYYSSGMKQRLKLALALLADTPVVLLDEPTSNLDTQGIDWYLQLIEQLTPNRLLLVASNQAHEYDFCSQTLDVRQFK